MSTQDEYIAHIDSGGRIQTASEHCRNTAKYASEDLMSIGLEQCGYLAGLLHDCGKFTDEFNRYIQASVAGKPVRKGSVIHTFAAAQYFLRNYWENDRERMLQNITSELLAYASSAHHGFYDCVSTDNQQGFSHRLEKQPEYDHRAIEHFINECAGQDELATFFRKASSEIEEKAFHTCYELASSDPNDKHTWFYYLGMIARLLTSAVIDGDRRDTAEFMTKVDFSSFVHGDDKLWEELLNHTHEYMSSFRIDTPINKARAELSLLCEQAGQKEPGIYQLNLPTGAGKTLGSLRYALEHARAFHKKRILYVAPLISILEQNADVLRKAVGRDDVVLEHHSNVIVEHNHGEELARYELMTETWDSPIIITTLVQLLNAMYDGKTSSIRRFQSLCDSVIIFDEVQTVPANMLTLFNLGINFLSSCCNATVILCSATQPCLEKTDHPLQNLKGTLIDPERVEQLSDVFSRTEMIDQGEMTLTECTDIIRELIRDNTSVLVVCNKKAEATGILETLTADSEDASCYSLTSAMCVEHRKKTIDAIKEKLDKNERVICVSTQVIEAGVDLSFSTVVRLTAGLDHAVQAAGRCNRNGEIEGHAPVYLVSISDESLNHLPEIDNQKKACVELLCEYKQNPKNFGNSIVSTEAVNYYYKILFRRMKKEEQDYSIHSVRSNYYEMMSMNSDFMLSESYTYYLRQAFKTAGNHFDVIKETGESVFVPYGEGGKKIHSEILSEDCKWNPKHRYDILKRMKPYMVNVFSYQLKEIAEQGGIHSAWDGELLILDERYYNNITGLQSKGGEEWSIQML